MAKTKISEYDSTAANNTDIDSINIAEGMAPSNVNNAIRELMAHLKDGLGAGTPVFLDQTNNAVGIGTSSPESKVAIKGSSGDSDLFSISDTTVPTSGTEYGVAMIKTNSTDFALNISGYNAASKGVRIYGNGGAAARTLLEVTRAAGTAMLVDGDGNVGIGTSSPAYALDVASSVIQFGNSTDAFAQYKSSAGNWHVGANSSNAFAFYSGTYGSGTERMRIDSSGNLIIGATAAFTSGGSNSGGTGALMIARNSERCLFLKRAFSNGSIAEFFRGGITAAVGSISITASATSYNTSSDYRLKENVEALSGAITRVKQLQPKRFSWIVDDEDSANVDGFLAHEAQTVVPEAVTGTHDGMKDEEYEVSAATGDIYTPATEETEEVIHSNNIEKPDTLEEGQQWRETTAAVMGTRSVPDYQGIDQAKLVPLLTAALQEAIAKIEALETRVTALEG